MKFTLQQWLEVINGSWAVAAMGLFLVATFYLVHEWRARNISLLGWRRDLTLGMRVAISVATLSLAIAITRAFIWVWRVIYHANGFNNWQMSILVFGGALGLAGFICAVREYSRSLYGDLPWIMTAVVALLVAMLTALPHIVR